MVVGKLVSQQLMNDLRIADYSTVGVLYLIYGLMGTVEEFTEELPVFLLQPKLFILLPELSNEKKFMLTSSVLKSSLNFFLMRTEHDYEFVDWHSLPVVNRMVVDGKLGNINDNAA